MLPHRHASVQSKQPRWRSNDACAYPFSRRYSFQGWRVFLGVVLLRCATGSKKKAPSCWGTGLDGRPLGVMGQREAESVVRAHNRRAARPLPTGGGFNDERRGGRAIEDGGRLHSRDRNRWPVARVALSFLISPEEIVELFPPPRLRDWSLGGR